MSEKYLGNPEVTAKQLYAADLTASYSKNVLTHPTQKYDGAQKQMSPQNPLWWVHTLVLSRQNYQLPEFARQFLVYDDKFFLRGGAVHTEMGVVYPEIVKSDSIPKPGEALTTPRADYIRIIQEESGKDPIYLRTHVDQRKFDHAERFYSFFDYAQIMDHYIKVLSDGNVLFLETLIAAMIIAYTGGAVMFDEGSQLERFFQPTGKDICPTEEWSKKAREFYKDDGETKKVIKREAGRVAQCMKNRAIYDPTLIIDEINMQKVEIREPEKFPDISDEAKTKKWLKSMYCDSTDPKKTNDLSRRKALWGLLGAIEYKCHRMNLSRSVQNWMGYDTSKESRDDTYDFPMRCEYTDMVVLMNSEDYMDAKVTTGGLAIGMFAATQNSTLQNLQALGVTFHGVPYMLPGTFLILHKYQLQIVQYFDDIGTDKFFFHLVDTWIRHTMLKVISFTNFPGHFGAMKTFQPSYVWLGKHYNYFKDAA